MTDWLDELVEISKKDIGELTKEDMAKLIMPLIDLDKLHSSSFPTISFSGIYSRNPAENNDNHYKIQFFTQSDIKDFSKEQLIKLSFYLSRLNVKLQQILNGNTVPQKYYDMIPVGSYVNCDFLNIIREQNTLDYFVSSDLDRLVSNIIVTFSSIVSAMAMCATRINRQSNINTSSPIYGNYYMHVCCPSNIFHVRYMTYGMMFDPSDFIYFSDFFRYGDAVAKSILESKKEMKLTVNNDIHNALNEKPKRMEGLDTLKIFYILRKGEPCVLNVFNKSRISLRMSGKLYDLVEKIWSLTEREVLAGCIANMKKARKNTGYGNARSVTTNSFDMFIDEGSQCGRNKSRIAVLNKQNYKAYVRDFELQADSFDSDKNIVSLLDLAFDHALQKREEKERMVEELPDMDR